MTKDFDQHLALARSTKKIHNKWYLTSYPDVAALDMDSAVHYLRYGAAMGRNPSKAFHTQFYIDSYPDVAAGGLNPLVHYELHGKANGYAIVPKKPTRPNFFQLRRLLLSAGLEEKGMETLMAIFKGNEDPDTRARAGLEIALWHFRFRTEDGFRTAIRYLEEAAEIAASLEPRRRLLMLKLICMYHLNEQDLALAFYDEMAKNGLTSPDGMLAAANLQRTPEARLAYINGALMGAGIAPISLLPDDGRPLYDRMAPGSDLPAVEDGPKVTVLLAAYDSGEMIGTALRSLQDQTWKNLEIIVIDDCSPTMETCEVTQRYAAADPRIKLLRMEKNGGAYIARNRGLDEATGDYVTLHDADDWSHPMKIETQVRFMEANSHVMGCTSEQVRCTDDLIVGKPRGGGLLVVFNTSSFLWRRVPVCEALGYWDTVRFGADSEFMRRMQTVFGEESVVKIPTGILSLQREAETSVTTDPVKGLDGSGVFYGVRKEYREAQEYHHGSAASLKYTNQPDNRPFPVPPMMLLPGDQGYSRTFDVVICGDFREGHPDLDRLIDDIELQASQGKSIALVESNSDHHNDSIISARVRKLLIEGKAHASVYGEQITTRVIKGNLPGKSAKFVPNISLIVE